MISEKSAHIFKMDDTLVRHLPVYISFLDDSPGCQTHPLGNVVTVTLVIHQGIMLFNLLGLYIEEKNWNCINFGGFVYVYVLYNFFFFPPMIMTWPSYQFLGSRCKFCNPMDP